MGCTTLSQLLFLHGEKGLGNANIFYTAAHPPNITSQSYMGISAGFADDFLNFSQESIALVQG